RAAAIGSTTALTQTHGTYSLQRSCDANQRQIKLSQNGCDVSVRREDLAAALFYFTRDFCCRVAEGICGQMGVGRSSKSARQPRRLFPCGSSWGKLHHCQRSAI